MDFKKLNQQRVSNTVANSSAKHAKTRAMTEHQKASILKSINELHDKLSNAQQISTCLEREMPKVQKEVQRSQAAVDEAATSIARARLNRAREKLSGNQLGIKGTEASIQAWEEEIAQKKKTLIADRRLHDERSASGSPSPVQQADGEVVANPLQEKAAPRITRRTVRVPVGPSLEQITERQAEEVLQRRAKRERYLQEKMENVSQPSGHRQATESTAIMQTTAEKEMTPTCGKRKRANDDGTASKKNQAEGKIW